MVKILETKENVEIFFCVWHSLCILSLNKVRFFDFIHLMIISLCLQQKKYDKKTLKSNLKVI